MDWVGELNIILSFDAEIELPNKINDSSKYLVIFILMIVLSVAILGYDRRTRFSKKMINNINTFPMLVPRIKEALFISTLVFTILVIYVSGGFKT